MDDVELLTGDDLAIGRFLERNRFTDLPADWSMVVGHARAKRELKQRDLPIDGEIDLDMVIDRSGSESMRASLWQAIRDELDAHEDRAMQLPAPHDAALVELADRLLHAGSLSGSSLVGAIRRPGITEAAGDD